MASPSGLTCLRCGTDYPAEEIVTGCARCRSEGFAVNLRPTYPASAFRGVQEARGFDPEERGVWRYHELLPAGLAHASWLGEGETPLVHAGALGELVGLENLYLKNETRNPTGSYKDRMALAMIEGAERSGALRPGQTVVEYTGGSTGSSLAFVCALKGYPLRIVSATCFAAEKIQTLRAFGAPPVVTIAGYARPPCWSGVGSRRPTRLEQFAHQAFGLIERARDVRARERALDGSA